MLPDGVTPPADWTSLTSWQAVLANDNTDNTRGKYLPGIGSLPAPDVTTQRIVDTVEVVTYKEYTLTHKVRALDDLRYEYLRKLQCSPVSYKFWMYTKGEQMIGGATGIQPVFTNVNFIYAEGKTEIVEAQLIIRFGSSACDPPRADIPNFAENLAGLVTTPRVLGSMTTVLGTNTNVF